MSGLPHALRSHRPKSKCGKFQTLPAVLAWLHHECFLRVDLPRFIALRLSGNYRFCPATLSRMLVSVADNPVVVLSITT